MYEPNIPKRRENSLISTLIEVRGDFLHLDTTNIHGDTQEMPKSRKAVFPRHLIMERKKEQW